MSKIKLFCFPYAGGSAAMVYSKWKRYLHQNIELHAVELAGRGRRFGDPMYTSIQQAVDEVFTIVKHQITTSDYAIFGHSMGSMIGYELCRKIKHAGLKNPAHGFFSGRQAPHIPERKFISNLPDNEFMEEIVNMEGTPRELLENKELMEYFFPLLKADFKIVEEYSYTDDGFKMDFNITILNGREDKDVTLNDIIGWKNFAGKDYKTYMFNGGHFYIHDNIENIAKIINHSLLGDT